MKLRKILVLLITLCAFTVMEAAHIIGGDVTYKCMLIDSAARETTYEITMTVYRDSRGGGAQFDNPARFGIFIGNDRSWNHLATRQITIRSSSNITGEQDPCIIVPPTIGVERGEYIFTVTLPWSDRTYKIAYQRCCRNNTITNIRRPGETGAVFSVDIFPEAQTSCNNSPVFDDFPPIVICAGVPLNIDQSATDAEGDQLVYEFCTPLAAGGTAGATTPGDPNGCDGVMPDPMICLPIFDEVEFDLPAYSVNNPLGASSGVAIDFNTGQITGEPTLIGQYVVGVCVKEFRDGNLIGEIRRDFQFNVAFCEIAVQAEITPDNPKATIENVTGRFFEINSCGPTTLRIENLSQDIANIDGYLWSMDIAGSTVTQDTRDAEFQFPGLGTYTGSMILNPGATSCSDTAFLEINILPAIESDFEFAYDTCIAGEVSFTDLSTTGDPNGLTNWSWEFNNEGESDQQNIAFRFPTPGNKEVALAVEDSNQCRDTIIKIVDWNPAPDLIVIDPSQFVGCKPSPIVFTNLTTPIDETYDITWDFGDGNISNEISPTHLYEEAGIYDVMVNIVSPIGCEAIRFYPQLIEVKEKPIAEFEYTPEQPSSFRKEVSFIDQSIDAISWTWNFANIGAAFEQFPTFTFPDTGFYNVELIVVHPEGCTDTTIQTIDVKPIVSLHFPNAFTPNNDGLNDQFKGKGELRGITDYNLKIWNRWGEQLFESEDPANGWNGEYNNNGVLSPQGVYVYTVTYIGPRGKPQSGKGYVTLVR